MLWSETFGMEWNEMEQNRNKWNKIEKKRKENFHLI